MTGPRRWRISPCPKGKSIVPRGAFGCGPLVAGLLHDERLEVTVTFVERLAQALACGEGLLESGVQRGDDVQGQRERRHGRHEDFEERVGVCVCVCVCVCVVCVWGRAVGLWRLGSNRTGLRTQRNCSFCKAVEQRGDTFKVCGGCRVAMYCSPNCQKSDWKEVHKVECKKLQGLP